MASMMKGLDLGILAADSSQTAQNDNTSSSQAFPEQKTRSLLLVEETATANKADSDKKIDANTNTSENEEKKAFHEIQYPANTKLVKTGHFSGGEGARLPSGADASKNDDNLVGTATTSADQAATATTENSSQHLIHSKEAKNSDDINRQNKFETTNSREEAPQLQPMGMSQEVEPNSQNLYSSSMASESQAKPSDTETTKHLSMQEADSSTLGKEISKTTINFNSQMVDSGNDMEEQAKTATTGGDDIEILDKLPEDVPKKRCKSGDESQDRKKRRRRLRRMLKEAGEFPSFVALISASPDNAMDDEDDEAKDDKMPEVIHIDVDEYLGLNDCDHSNSTTAVPDPRSNGSPGATSQDGPLGGRLRSRNRPSSESAVSMIKENDAKKSTKAQSTSSSTPAEEGYYEGRVPLASPDDEQYLTSLQQLIRSHLEYFSATATDAAGSQAGRRLPIIRGKVGIRCIHCAKVGLEHEAAMAARAISQTPVKPDKPLSESDSAMRELSPGGMANASGEDGADVAKLVDPSRVWPPGSISYPLNIAGLYSICSQKPQLHFEHCPNLPPQVKAQFYRHMHESSKAGEVRIKSREVPAAMYYTVAAKRIGLVNVPDGIRFGRDLNLDPLPFDAVLAEELQESEEMKAAVPHTVAPHHSATASAPQAVGSSSSAQRISADAASEQVLAEAVAETDDPTRFLARAADKKLVTDFVFLCLRQMAFCHAVPVDFATRGKKTKSMRIGFAGFCCRYCQKVREQVDGSELARAHGASDFSCRSFSSVADNLASAISNSFALHLSKCPNVPKRVQAALAAYKRIHPRQMSQLPYGSQRRLFHEIWERLRAADIPENEMMDRIKRCKLEDAPAPMPLISKTSLSSGSRTNGKSGKGGAGRSDPDFPASSDPETLFILEKAEENWDSNNNGLIFPSDRELVSDYIFLTIRANLKVTLPTPADIAKGRKGTAQVIMAGMCCIHCEKEDPSLVAPAGRSFPSAPDNYASALNSSLYSHLQSCQYVPADMKRALSNLRKLHSQQIAHLKFGAQRRYFNLLFDRLRKVSLPQDIPTDVIDKASPPPKKFRESSCSTHAGISRGGRSRVTRRSEDGDASILTQFGFFEAPCQSFFCLRCRMVPLPFRARGSLSFARPSIDFMTEHKEVCKEDGFDLWFVVESLKKLLQTEFDVDHITNPLFKEVILECFGRDPDLANIFTNEIVKVYQMSRHGGVTRTMESAVKAKSQGLWCKLPLTIDSSKVLQVFEKFAETVKGMSPRLSDHKALVAFLLLISPSLALPGEGEEVDDEEGEEEEEKEKSRESGEEDGKEGVERVSRGDDDEPGDV